MRNQKLSGKSMPVLLMLVLMVVSAPIVAAQTQDFDPDYYESVMTGYAIEVSGPSYEITGAELQEYMVGSGEIVDIGSETVAANLEVSFYDDQDTPQESVDIYLESMGNVADSLEVIERGALGDSHYALALIDYEGVEIVFLIMVDEDVVGNVDMLQSMLTSALMMEADLEDAQDEVTIDGIPFMDAVSPDQLVEVLNGTGTLGDAPDATPVTPAETYTFTESDVTVGIGEDFAFDGDAEVWEDVEAVYIQGPETLSMIAVGQTGFAPADALQSFSGGVASSYADVEIVDEQSDDDSAWRLLLLEEGEGESSYMLITVDTTTVPGFELLQAHEVPTNSVAGSLVVIQEQITINDVPVLQDIDIEEIGNLATVDGDEPSTQTSVTPEADDEPLGDDGDSRSGDPRNDARLPEQNDEPTDDGSETGGNTSETGGTVEPVDEPTEEPATDRDTPGALTDSSWKGGVSGAFIEWDADTWFVDPDHEGDLVSDEEYQEDTIVLQQQTSAGTSLLFVSVYGATDLTPGDYMDHWLTDEYLTVFTDTGAEAEVVDYRTRGGNTAVIFRVTSESGDEFIVVRQAITLESGSVLLVTLDTPAADMPELYETAEEVTIDGESVMRIYSSNQIERAIGD